MHNISPLKHGGDLLRIRAVLDGSPVDLKRAEGDAIFKILYIQLVEGREITSFPYLSVAEPTQLQN